jgi:hypothetical protein
MILKIKVSNQEKNCLTLMNTEKAKSKKIQIYQKVKW